jgi:hypothetical protein
VFTGQRLGVDPVIDGRNPTRAARLAGVSSHMKRPGAGQQVVAPAGGPGSEQRGGLCGHHAPRATPAVRHVALAHAAARAALGHTRLHALPNPEVKARGAAGTLARAALMIAGAHGAMCAPQRPRGRTRQLICARLGCATGRDAVGRVCQWPFISRPAVHACGRQRARARRKPCDLLSCQASAGWARAGAHTAG